MGDVELVFKFTASGPGCAFVVWLESAAQNLILLFSRKNLV
jgi:hypothetical protein